MTDFSERGVVHDGTSTGGKIQSEEQVEKCRSVYPFLVPCSNDSSTGSDRCDQSPVPRLVSMETVEKIVSENIPCEGYHTAVECRFIDDYQGKRIIFRTESSSLRDGFSEFSG